MYKKRKKKIKQVSKDVTFIFWNNAIEYLCKITSPVDIPNYKLKEVFDRNFVGKKDNSIVFKDVQDFRALHSDITYEIKASKETANVR